MPTIKPLIGTTSELWGPSNISSKPKYHRYQYGFLAGILLGQGFEEDQSTDSCNDPYSEYTAECSEQVNQALLVEIWGGRSPGTGKNKHRALRPYNPLYNIGPYIRIEHGVNLLNLSFSPENKSASGSAIHFGVKTQLRLNKPIEERPDIPSELPVSPPETPQLP
mgnify:CR=1 FL=1